MSAAFSLTLPSLQTPPTALRFASAISPNGAMSFSSSRGNMTDSDTALVPWESINEQLFGTQHVRLDSSATPQITSLLSACSYPVPQQIRQPQRDPGYIQTPLLGYVPEAALYNEAPDMQATQPATKPPKRPRGDVNRSRSSLNKRGRPRKVVEDAVDEDPEEVRED